LHGLHPVVDQILEWRRLEKLDGTYAVGMIPHILSDGCIHPTFRLDGTETCRTSSENPNGQNIPRSETPEGKMARDAFRARPGRVMVSIDQSQIELRVAAGMSGDPEMIGIFKSGHDYHMRTAQLIAKVVWGIGEDVVGKYHRSYAKSVNFGLLYGKTDVGLAQQLGCTIDEAACVRGAILGRFRRLAAMIAKLLRHVRSYGAINIPWFGDAVHTRPLYEAGGQDKWKKQNAENSSVNSPIQGRAALYTIAAIPLIHDWIDASGSSAEIINTVHDSIMLDVDPSEVDDVIANCKRIMTSFDCWGVPLEVDVDAGERWGSLRGMESGETYHDAQLRWAVEALKAS
jgi:DNA polymerase-1